jgi:hypothetical protein
VLVISSGSSDDEQKSNVEQLPVKKPIVLSSASSEDDPIEQLSSHNIEMQTSGQSFVQTQISMFY